MAMTWSRALTAVGVLSCSALAGATDLTIHLNGSEMITGLSSTVYASA
jgi:hypothetical protein